MMKIRPSQLLALGETKEYVEHVRLHLAEHYPEEHARLGDAGLTRHVLHTLEVGFDHQIRSERSLMTLAELQLEFGPRFQRSPDVAWAHSILEHHRLPGVLKVRLLAERLRARTGGRRIVEIVVGEAGRN